MRDEGHQQGRATFAKRVVRPPSPDMSDYRPSTSDGDRGESVLDDSSDERERNEARTSVVELQRLYSDFLPPHLRLKLDTQKKRRKIDKRPAVYTKTSRTTRWRRDVALKKAAQGCATLDAFVLRKVCKPKEPQSKASHDSHRQ